MARAAAVRVLSAIIFSILTSVLGRGTTITPRELFWITIRWSLNKLRGGQYKEIFPIGDQVIFCVKFRIIYCVESKLVIIVITIRYLESIFI